MRISWPRPRRVLAATPDRLRSRRLAPEFRSRERCLRRRTGAIAVCPASAVGVGLREREADPPECLLDRDHPLGVGLRDRERPDFRSPQRRAMPAEHIRDRADIRPRADGYVERDDAVCIRDDVERIDARATHGHLDLDALAMQAIRALATDLHGGRRGDRQLDVTAEGRERRLELGKARRFVHLERVALGIARRRPEREVDVCEVALGETDKA